MSRQSVRLCAGFGLVLVILLGLSAATYRTTTLSDEAGVRVERSLRVITLTNAALGALGDLQLGELGVQLSGREAFRQSLVDAQHAYASDLAQLEQLTADDPAQSARWQQLPDPASGQFDAIRAGLNVAIASEQSLLEQRTAAAADDRRFLRVVLAVSALVAVLLSLAAAVFIQRDFQMADRLRSTMAQREAERAERLAELRARRALEALDRQKDEFLAVVSHDLRNPLAAIKGIAQILRRQLTRTGGIDPANLLDRVTGIDVAANAMAAQLDELLDLTRLQMGRTLNLRYEPVDLVALARVAVSTQQQATERHRLVFETDRDVLTVSADRMRLERVLMNLLSNAVKYSPLGGSIVVQLRRVVRSGSAWAVMDVRDPGVGIPADEMPRLFGSFYRATNVSDRIPGVGLGLAAVRQMVEAHHGRVEVESSEGRGSTFRVWLPAAA